MLQTKLSTCDSEGDQFLGPDSGNPKAPFLCYEIASGLRHRYAHEKAKKISHLGQSSRRSSRSRENLERVFE